MTDTPHDSVFEYIKKSFNARPIDRLVSIQTRAFAKWWLDLVRNFIIVGVLQYFAEKSGLWYVKALSAITYLVFFGYCMSYLDFWTFNPFHGMKTSWFKFFLSMVVGVILPVAILMGVSLLVYMSVDEIARLQAR